MPGFFALLAGLVFGIGLIVSGMANPDKVLGFLDLAGDWDPSLAFVMAGAVAVGVIRLHLRAQANRVPARTADEDADSDAIGPPSRRGRVDVRRQLGHCRLLPGTRAGRPWHG